MVHWYMLIAILTFIFPKSFSFIFYGQIWSQNLKFTKLTKIWYCGTLVYPYFDFEVCFFKIFLVQIWSQNLKFFRLTEISSRGALLYAYYHFITYFLKLYVNYNRKLSFFKIFLFKILWANLVPSCFLRTDGTTSYLYTKLQQIHQNIKHQNRY